MKALLTSGCSFSEDMGWLVTWNTFLEKRYKPEFAMHTGMGSSGNDLIARKALYMVAGALEKYNAEDIVLVLNWSTLDRKALLTDESNVLNPAYMRTDKYDNYLNCVKSQGSDLNNDPLDGQPAWVWFNIHWDDPVIQTWYADYDNEHQQLERTLWNMINVQNYCKAHNVKYYWTTVLNDLDNLIDRNNNYSYCKHLIKELDMSNRIDTLGQSEWIKTLNNDVKYMCDDWFHPNQIGHEKYTNDVIVPFLIKQGIIPNG